MMLFGMLVASRTGYGQTLAHDGASRTMTYQGMITDNETGKTISAQLPIAVALYSDEAGTQRIWQGSYLTTVTNGLFSIQLGSKAYPLPSASDLDRPLWVGVSVNTSEEMRPLTPLSASAYALGIADRTISAKKMATDYVASISIDGRKVTHRGSDLNIKSGPGMMLGYEESTNSLILGSTMIDADPNAANGNPIVPWAELGNNTTNPANDYVGTSDNQVLEIRVNGANNRFSNAGDGRVMLYDPKANSANIIGGFSQNIANNNAEGVTISGGGRNPNINRAFDNYGTIGGGVGNTTGTSSNGQDGQDEFQVIGGGEGNTAPGPHTAIIGGQGNVAGGSFSTIGGGRNNNQNMPLAAGDAFLGGGQNNRITDNHGTLGGGFDNAAGNDRSILPIISPLLTQFAPPMPSTTLDGEFATEGGGWSNTAAGYETSVLGGEDNIAFFVRGAVVGGAQNFNFAGGSFIGAGQDNQIQIISPNINRVSPMMPVLPEHIQTQFVEDASVHAVIGGGLRNLIFDSDNGAITGGRQNTIGGPGTLATNGSIGGGFQNTILAPASAIMGGQNNTITGTGSGIGGGQFLTIAANSFGFNGDAVAQTTNLSGFNNIAGFNNVNLMLGNTDGAPRDLLLFGSNNVALGGSLSYTGINFIGLRATANPAANSIFVLPAPGAISNGSIMFSSAGATGSTGNPPVNATTFQLNFASPSGAGAVPVATSGGLGFTSPASSNQVFTTDGSGNPGWTNSLPSGMTITATEFVGSGSTSSAVDLETAEVAGTLPVARGGTGVGTIDVNEIVLGNGTDDIVTVDDASATDGMVLTFIESTGVPAWRDLSADANGGWGTTGNNGTDPATNFLGPIGQTDFLIKTNGTQRIRVGGSGGVTVDNGGLLITNTVATTGAVSLEVEGGIATQPDTRDITTDLTQDITNMFTLAVGNRSYIRLHSSGTGNFNRRIVLTDGRVNGQLLIIESAEDDADQKFHFRNQKTSDNTFANFDKLYLRNGKRLTFDTRDIGMFVFNDDKWLRLFKSSNTNTEPTDVDDDDVD